MQIHRFDALPGPKLKMFDTAFMHTLKPMHDVIDMLMIHCYRLNKDN